MITQSISDILSAFDDEALLRLAAHSESVCDGEISGLEWVQIITYIKNNPNLASLKPHSLYTIEDCLYTPSNNYHAAVNVDGKYIGIADKDVYVYDYPNEKWILASEYKRIYNQRTLDFDVMYIKCPNTGEYIKYVELLSNMICQYLIVKKCKDSR